MVVCWGLRKLISSVIWCVIGLVVMLMWWMWFLICGLVVLLMCRFIDWLIFSLVWWLVEI